MKQSLPWRVVASLCIAVLLFVLVGLVFRALAA